MKPRRRGSDDRSPKTNSPGCSPSRGADRSKTPSRSARDRKGQLVAKVRDDVRADLEAVGRERALLYKVLVLTGPRRGELVSLIVAQLRLDGRTPFVELDAADEKNREGSAVAIRADPRQWLADRAEARRLGKPIPARLDDSTPLFNVPANLLRTFDRDLKAAKIPKRDDRGRTLDVHALRHTFGTLLSKGGVSLRAARAAMRHSDPKLTANVYTDPRLLDVAGALHSLTSLPLDADPSGGREREQAAATGTDGRGFLAPDTGIGRQNEAKASKLDTIGGNSPVVGGFAASPFPTNVKASPQGRGETADEGM